MVVGYGLVPTNARRLRNRTTRVSCAGWSTHCTMEHEAMNFQGKTVLITGAASGMGLL